MPPYTFFFFFNKEANFVITNQEWLYTSYTERMLLTHCKISATCTIFFIRCLKANSKFFLLFWTCKLSSPLKYQK